MSNNQAIAGAEEPVSNISIEELIAQRIGKATASQEESLEESEEETEEEDDLASSESEDVEESDEESEEENEEETEGQNEIDLLDLTTEQIQELAKKGKSRLLQRIGELTAQKKALEEKLTAQPQVAESKREIPQNDIPESIRSLKTFEEIKSKFEEYEAVIEATDDLLRQYRKYDDDDIIEYQGQELTKLQIENANINSRKALTKYLPAQQQHLGKIAQYDQLNKQYVAAIEQEVPEINDSESEIGKNYANFIADPLIERVRKEIPEIGIQIEYILGHAVRSIFAGKKLKSTTPVMGSKLKASPPSNPVGSGAAKSSVKPTQKVKDAYQRFESSGRPEDWIAARISKFK